MDVPACLRSLLQDVALRHHCHSQDIDIRPTNTLGANYTTSLYFATLSKGDKETIELFAKVATICESIRKAINGDRLFSAEDFFYNDLMNTYNNLQIDNNIPKEMRLVFPKFYGSSTKNMQETIVLENLLVKGYTTFGRKSIVSLEYAFAAMEVLAKWHALSMALERKHPTEFQRVLSEVPFSMPEDSDENRAANMKIANGAVQIVRAENRGRVQAFLHKFNRDLYEQCHRGRGRIVLSHGDFRPSNLMYKIVNGKYEVIPIDFQMIHPGCVQADILYFIFTCTDREFRRRHLTTCVDHYYRTLAEVLKAYDLDINVEYPRRDLDAYLKDNMIYGMVVGLVILPTVTVDEASVPQLTAGADMGHFAVAPNKLYEERFNGIIDDLVEWGLM